MKPVVSPKGWVKYTLGELATIERTTIQPENIQTGTIYLGLEHITSEGQFTEIKAIASGELASSKFAFNDKHLLYGKLRPYLKKIARPNFSGVCSTDILPITPGSKLDRDFLYYYLRQPSYINLATAISTGANLPRLSPKDLAKFHICIPSLEEQRRIAAILDKADAVRRKRQQAIALTEELLRSAFLEMFGDPVTNAKRWNTDYLGNHILHANNGLSRRRKTFQNEGEIVLRLQDIKAGYISFSDPNRIALDNAEKKRYLLEPNDLVFIRVNGNKEYVGRCAVYKSFNESIYHNDHIIRIQTSSKISPEYLAFVFNSPFGKKILQSQIKTSAGQYTISQKGIESLQLAIPPRELQDEFIKLNGLLEEIKNRYQTSLMESQTLFNSLIQKAFCGEL